MATLELVDLVKRYTGVTAVDRVALDVGDGEMVALLGPSGCGKTTTLRMVAGFVEPDEGRVLLGGVDVTRTPPYRRNAGMVFQSYALFPHMNVATNVAFGLEMRRIAAGNVEERVAEALRRVRMEHLAQRLPRELSGGQQQRVALARALVIRPDIFLLDEPLSNLDAKLRSEVRTEIRELQQRLKLTTLLVTHDQEEALTMADRLVVLHHGRVQQTGTPEELYERPANTFVASFIGRCNLLRGEVMGEREFRSEQGLTLPCAPCGVPAGPHVFALRPERIRVHPPDGPAPPSALGAQLVAAQYCGSTTEYRLRAGAETLIAVAPTPPRGDPMHAAVAGGVVRISWEPDAVTFLPDDLT